MINAEVSTIEEVTVEQTKYAYCHKAKTQVGMRGSEFQADHKGLLALASKIDACLPIVEPVLLKVVMVLADRELPSAGHPSQRRMYDTI